jgi:hypothetical protein
VTKSTYAIQYLYYSLLRYYPITIILQCSDLLQPSSGLFFSKPGNKIYRCSLDPLEVTLARSIQKLITLTPECIEWIESQTAPFNFSLWVRNRIHEALNSNFEEDTKDLTFNEAAMNYHVRKIWDEEMFNKWTSLHIKPDSVVDFNKSATDYVLLADIKYFEGWSVYRITNMAVRNQDRLWLDEPKNFETFKN